MSRIAMCTTLLICASSLACVPKDGTLSEGDGICPSVLKNEIAQLTVDKSGKVDPPCILITAGASKVVWGSGRGVKSIEIQFKRNWLGVRPFKPDCPSGMKECTLAAATTNKKSGFFDYGVTVTPETGPPVVVDPRLIIQP